MRILGKPSEVTIVGESSNSSTFPVQLFALYKSAEEKYSEEEELHLLLEVQMMN